MKYKTMPILVALVLFGINISFSQSIFTTKEEVADYLEGEWNLDLIQGGLAGATYYLPTPFYYDSTIHKILFEKTEIDSLPLICKAFINDSLSQTTFVRISENPSQILLPRWLLFDLPNNLELNVGLMESEGFYGFSQDTMVFSGIYVADGFDFGLSRLTSSTDELIKINKVNIFPNPSTGKIFVKGVPINSSFKVYTLDGSLVKKGRLNGNMFSLENNGIFILNIELPDRRVTRKIINGINF